MPIVFPLLPNKVGGSTFGPDEYNTLISTLTACIAAYPMANIPTPASLGLFPSKSTGQKMAATEFNSIVTLLGQVVTAANGVGAAVPLTAGLTLSTASVTTGTAVTFTATASGGTAPYTYLTQATNTATGGVLNLGAAASSNWTPQTAGTFDITTTVTDSAGVVKISPVRQVSVTAAALPQPAATNWSVNPQTRVLSQTGPAGYESAVLEYRQGSGAYQDYTAGLLLDGAAHSQGEWQGRVKATSTNQAGQVGSSPAIAVSATPAPTGPPYYVLFTGNSNVEGNDTNGRYPTKCMAFLGSNYVGYNAGNSGRSIDWMQANLNAHVAAANFPTNKPRYALAMEGTNTLRRQDIWDENSFFDAVKTYMLDLKGRGFIPIWITTMPNTIPPGSTGDSNPDAQLSNAWFVSEFPSLGIHVIDLSNTLIGKFGSAQWGADAGFSSYGVVQPGPPESIAANDFYYDGTHLKQRGTDILGRVAADKVLNLSVGTAVPDRSQFGAVTAPTGPVAEDMLTKNLVNMSFANKRLTVTGAGSFTCGANGTKGIGQGTGAEWGRIGAKVKGSEMFFGLTLASGLGPDTGINNMPFSLYFTLESLQPVYSFWSNGGKIADLGSRADDDEFVFVVGPSSVKVLRNGQLAYTHNVTVAAPLFPDFSGSSAGHYFDLPFIQAEVLVTAS